MPNAHGSKWIRPEKRLAIYARDGFACIYCGETAEEGHGLSLDHVIPREMGGTHEAENLVTACVSCNSMKRDVDNRRFFEMLRDKGIDTTNLSRRIRNALARKLDMAEGKKLLAARKR
jgi:5-methylcytosine-specific restriction endonuclease McrA